MAEPRPNVLLICTDHWPANLLGCAGHPAVQTPTLDQLATNGVQFTNAYSECPVCVPARRTLMTGLTPYSHGMLQNAHAPMPDVPTIAQTFHDHGYQASVVGKLHVQPQRQRIGFDEVLLDEEGRIMEDGLVDDYELYLADHGHAGERFSGGMCNNNYMWRPWHLDEHLHVTNWAAQQMARQIRRRDPLRPGFWYLSFSHPHPPLAPLQSYLDMYRDIDVPEPFVGDWVDAEDRPYKVTEYVTKRPNFNAEQTRLIRRAFYALCTQIDHQLRVVLGTLREEKLLENTIICFTADHGDMLGNHHMWAKQHMYEGSNNVPMLLMGTQQQMADGCVGHGRIYDRLVALRDVMPTLLSLAGLPVPDHCEGLPMVGNTTHEHMFGCFGREHGATRMMRDQQHKLIYHPCGNRFQLFDMLADPCEMNDLSGSTAHDQVIAQLSARLVDALDDHDRADWVTDGKLTGLPDRPAPQPGPDRGFNGQRGTHFPPPTRK